MNCFTHAATPAVGLCSLCQRALCRSCVARAEPRLICASCAERGIIGYEYRSGAALGNWPLVHVCAGLDPATGRPRVARGVIAVGNVAVGAVAVGGVALGLVSLGGLAIGLLLAIGGAALGTGVSFGGLAFGAVAIGGGAIGFSYAVGGAAFAPAAIDGQHCDAAARAFVERWVGPGALPPSCR